MFSFYYLVSAVGYRIIGGEMFRLGVGLFLICSLGYRLAYRTGLLMARRIMFALQFYGGNGIIQSNQEPALFLPTYWSPTENQNTLDEKPIYADGTWMCFSNSVDSGKIWISEFPTIDF